MRKVKKNDRMGENICKLYLIRDNYKEYIRNSCNSMIKVTIKKGQRI